MSADLTRNFIDHTDPAQRGPWRKLRHLLRIFFRHRGQVTLLARKPTAVERQTIRLLIDVRCPRSNIRFGAPMFHCTTRDRRVIDKNIADDTGAGLMQFLVTAINRELDRQAAEADGTSDAHWNRYRGSPFAG